ncbi:hypothetical protein [Sphingomonas bacterium]|uniref:hypothetical protein n=1 Tax=Sphingomonas bacterium TaxID=1895847 RepID=UPI002637C67A|nr:hypothetical protein [Sphingomonas bacterium]MDB5677368.1 hypothetical protein [Sphingomonas bacterium]
MGVEELNLIEPALSGARHLKAQFPHIIFTSGARSVVDQARAMAQNIAQDRHGYLRVYKARAEANELQAWVDAHPAATSVAAIQAGLLSVMNAWPAARQMKLSSHLGGLAFDVQPLPDGPAATAIKAAIRALPHCTFLEREGKLTRWHAQFA